MGGDNNNSNNRGRKNKSVKGNSWNGGGNSNSVGNSWNGSNSGGSGKQRPSNVKLFNNNNYFLSHGHDLPSDHSSATCNNQCPDHCTIKIATNTMAGNSKHQERTLWPGASGWPEIIPKQMCNQNGNGIQGGQQGNMMQEFQRSR